MKRIVLISCLITLVWGLPLQAGNRTMDAMVYQPVKADLAIDETTWAGYFDRMRLAGIETVYISRIKHGNIDFLTEKIGKEPFIGLLYDLAGTYGLTIRAGLYQDPEFESNITLPPEKLKSYLSYLRERSLETAVKISGEFSNHPAFEGWLLPELVDDRNWRSKVRQDIIADHLSTMVEELNDISPRAPVVVLSKLSGQMTPDGFADMWQYLLLKARFILLVQDGVGTSGFSVYDSGHYVSALDKTLKARYPWGVCVELFEREAGSTNVNIRPATVSRVRKQLNSAGSFSGPVTFPGCSLRYFLFDGSKLGKDYMN